MRDFSKLTFATYHNILDTWKIFNWKNDGSVLLCNEYIIKITEHTYDMGKRFLL